MLWIVLTLIVYTTAPQSDGGGQHADQSESQVRKAEEELTSALLRSDVSGLRRMYAEDYVHIGTDGLLPHKPDRITEFATGLRKITQLRREDVQVSIYGNVALVRDIDTVQGSFRGKRYQRPSTRNPGLAEAVNSSPSNRIIALNVRGGQRTLSEVTTRPIRISELATIRGTHEPTFA
jgi:ketosteroid isomerase-like protein